MITLRDYQETLINKVRVSMVKNKHVILCAPTGAGKTVMFSYIAQQVVAQGKKVLCISHRTKLLTQTGGSMQQFGLKPVYIKAGAKKVPFDKNVYVAMAQTLRRRIEKQKWADFIASIDLIIIDECAMQDTNYLFDSGLIDDKYVIGATATPMRTGNMVQLGMHYDDICETLKTEDVVRMGYLCSCKSFLVPNDVSHIKKVDGEFQPKDSYKHFDKLETYGGLIDNYNKICKGKKFICFCTTIAHAIKTCVQLNEAGIKTKFVVSNLNEPKEPKKKEGSTWETYKDKLETYNLYIKYKQFASNQEDVAEEIESGKITGVVNVNILAVGTDIPCLEVCILLRSTTSKALYLQMLGRCSRLYGDKKEFIFLDFGDNERRLGSYIERRNFCLWHEQSDSVGLPKMKTCGEKGKDKNGKEGCKRLILASFSICPKCGYRFATESELRVVELTEKLEEAPKRFYEMSAQNLLDYAELHNYGKKWVFRQLYIKGDAILKNGMQKLNRMEESKRKENLERLGLTSCTEPEHKVKILKMNLKKKYFKEGMRELGYDNKFIYRQLNLYKGRKR